MKTTYPIFTPKKTCPHVLPRLDLTSEKKVSVLIPLFKHFGRKEGSLHFRCIRGVISVSASTEGISCVVALRVYFVAS